MPIEAVEALPFSERYAAGKALRKVTPRAAHADFKRSKDFDPLAVLAETDAARISELLPVRYDRMAASPFAFLRGAASIMAADLQTVPAAGLPVQACGDCHLMNFGVFATPEGRILFDINDFDETLPGVDFTVDLKRLISSIAVAAQDAGWSDDRAEVVAARAVASYRKVMHRLARNSPFSLWHLPVDLEEDIDRFADSKLRRKVRSILIRSRDQLAADDNFPKLVDANTTGSARIADQPPLIYHFNPEGGERHSIDTSAVFSAYDGSLDASRRSLYRRYRLVDTAFKVVGVGSVGTFCAIGLFECPDGQPLFLQIKEASRSVLEKLALPCETTNQGQRVVEGQRMMQAASDIFLGWTVDPLSGRHFYVRHLKNRRLSSIGELLEGKALAAYGELCAQTLARAHARSGDAAMIAGYVGRSDAFDKALATFAMRYARQTMRDHQRLLKTRRRDRQRGVRKSASS